MFAFYRFKDTTSLRYNATSHIYNVQKYPHQKEKSPTNRGLFHDFRFSLGYDNLQQDGISEAVGSLTVFTYTAGKGLPDLLRTFQSPIAQLLLPSYSGILKFTVILWVSHKGW